MPTKVEKVRSIKTIKFISFDKLLWEKETRTVVNPFSNLLEMLECYCSIADKQDMERLKIFVKKSQSEENDPIMYKWACYAVSACQKCCAVSENT